MDNKKQTTSTILMIRPKHFGFNQETAGNNTFQAKEIVHSAKEMQEKALSEFDNMVNQLRNAKIHVLVIEDSDEPQKPDAVFPNNWITTHEDGSVITYPMFSQKRRHERREDVIESLALKYNIKNRYAFEHYESKEKFLEGTGSMVLDRVNKVVYACLSPRTDIGLLDKFGILKGYKIIRFIAQSDGVDIYHTNVMMAIGTNFVVICLDAVPDASDREMLKSMFHETGKEVIVITAYQMNNFAGNMLAVSNLEGEEYLIMSQKAFSVLSQAQISKLANYAQIISAPIDTIEKYGGGSARCMIAEIFLDRSLSLN